MNFGSQDDMRSYSLAPSGSSRPARQHHPAPTATDPGGPSTTTASEIRDDNPPARKRRRKAPTTHESEGARLLACLFYRADPFIYHRCGNFLMHRFGDLVQHLERKHAEHLILYCPVCFQVFVDEPKRDGHVEARLCEPRPESQCVLGITPEQLEQVKRIQARGGVSEKWAQAWNIVFAPDAAAPSPDPFIEGNVMDTIQALRRRATELLRAYPNTGERLTPEAIQAILDLALPTHQPVWPGPPGRASPNPPVQMEPELNSSGAGPQGEASVAEQAVDWYGIDRDDHQQSCLGAYGLQIPYGEHHETMALTDDNGDYPIPSVGDWVIPNEFEDALQSAGYAYEEGDDYGLPF